MEDTKTMTKEEQILFSTLKIIGFITGNLPFEVLKNELEAKGFEFSISTCVTARDENLELYKSDIANSEINPDYISRYDLVYDGNKISFTNADFINKEFLEYLVELTQKEENSKYRNFIVEDLLNEIKYEEKVGIAALSIFNFVMGRINLQTLKNELEKEEYEFSIVTSVTESSERYKQYKNDIANLDFSADYISKYNVSFDGKSVFFTNENFSNELFLTNLLRYAKDKTSRNLLKERIEQIKINKENEMTLR